MKRAIVAFLTCGLTGLLPCAQAATVGPTPFADAVAVWHMADARDSAGAGSALRVEGEVKFGVDLEGADRKASLARGGDGKVAKFDGGWLAAGNGVNGALNLTGNALTICVRLKVPSGKWAAGLLTKKADAKNYNLFAWDLGRGMEFGFEFNLSGGGQAKLVRTPLAAMALDGWHDLVVRYDGARLELFVDGVARDQTPASGQVAGVPEASFLIGADPGGKNPFHGLIDHAALWNRALTDAEVESLCGGPSARQEREWQARQQQEQEAQQAEAKLNEAMQQRISADPYYPLYHLAPPAGWLGDPHPLYFKGAYHMFYQLSTSEDPYVLQALDGPWGWAHAMSKDLVHWKHMPPAITSKDHGVGGAHDIFSGCLVDNNGVGTAIYTIENIDIWTSTSKDADLRAFTKYGANPIIKGPPPGMAIEGGMRDPWVWKEPDGWYLIVGSGLQGGKGSVLPLYKSTDLVHWQYLHPLYQGDPSKEEGTFSECPFFFPLGDKHVLALSAGATWMTGTFKDERFQPEERGRLGYGRFYVPQTLLDGKGRRILWGWIWEAVDATLGAHSEVLKRRGWASMQTLPRVVSLADDKALRFDPAPELETLRAEHHQEKNLTVGSTPIPIQNSRGMQAELKAVFTPGSARSCGLILQDKAELLRVAYDAGAKILHCMDQAAPLELELGEDLTLRVFLDRSVVEVYANRKVFVVERIYPQDINAVEARLFAEGGEAKVKQVDAWQMKSIW